MLRIHVVKDMRNVKYRLNKQKEFYIPSVKGWAFSRRTSENMEKGFPHRAERFEEFSSD
jgi:hypothetical protein